MKYRALREDNDILVNLLIAIFGRRRRILKLTPEEKELDEQILTLIEKGERHKDIRENLDVTEYRIFKAIDTRDIF